MDFAISSSIFAFILSLKRIGKMIAEAITRTTTTAKPMNIFLIIFITLNYGTAKIANAVQLLASHPIKWGLKNA
jgi:TRAP-type C4-dicarboxylate transport system permease large subunit